MELDKTTTLRNLDRLRGVIQAQIADAAVTTPWSELAPGSEAADNIEQMIADITYVRNLSIELEQGNSAIEEYPMVERKNLMSGEYFLEDLDTPIYCSPSSESFWSM